VLVEVDDDVLGRVVVAALLHLLGGPAVALAVEAALEVAPAHHVTYVRTKVSKVIRQHA